MKTILVVDEDSLFLDLVVHVLKSDAVAVLTATTIERAKQLFDAHKPAVVIIDPRLPHGVDFIGYIRSSETCVDALALSKPGTTEILGELHALGLETIIDRSSGIAPLLAAVRVSLEEGPAADTPNEQIEVLVVDDDPELLKLLRQFLSKQGYSVLTASTAAEALTVWAEHPRLSVMVLDIILPGQGGLAFLREVKQRPNPPGVIIMTGLSDEVVAHEAMRLGAFDYVVKPLSRLEDLDDLIFACATRVEYQRKWWDYELEHVRDRARAWLRTILESSEVCV